MLLKTATLGCKVNQYETEYLRTALRSIGYVDGPDELPADLVLVNTCSVTQQSDFKSRKIIRKLAKENPGAEIVVFGCYAARAPEEVASLPGVSAVVPDKRLIPEFLRSRGLLFPPPGIEEFGERHRAFIKVQDGCIVSCAYCIIPKVRPYLSSRPIPEILTEISLLARNGYREIVLTGIHLGHYGLDQPEKPTLSQLIERILEIPEKDFRVRISSLEAVEVGDDLINLAVEHGDRICPHFHLSMQSGSDEVLKNMKRRWSSEPFIERCERIIEKLEQPALTTDVIVGFPGETDQQFEETCKVVERIGFSKVHVFRFSPREGTEAAEMKNRVPPEIQKARAAHLQKIADRLRFEYAKSLIGRKLNVLFERESKDGNTVHGTSDRYLDVTVPNESQKLIGSVLPVLIDEAKEENLFGTLPK